jgi:lysyl-tRNA synthetase class 2
MPSPFWSPDRHADRRPALLARGRIKAAIRAWFEEQGFVEVETACLQASPGNETHLHAFRTERIGTDLSRTPLYLHTSPEFAMKKLLAAGEERIFTFAPCFRNRERGALHAPEFTMLEWYRAGVPYEEVMDDAVVLLALACNVTGQRLVSWRGATCHPAGEAERVTVAEAFARCAGIDLLSTIVAEALLGSPFPSRGGVRGGGSPHDSGDEMLTPPPTPLHQGEGGKAAVVPDRDRLAHFAEGAGITARPGDSWADIYFRVLAALIEPKLGLGRPSLLMEYPATEAALARPKPEDARVAERFELYCCGVELANGYGELTDPMSQRLNLEAQMTAREAIYGERYPIDEDFIAALAHMPPASGCALGFDRLVMLATGATHIDQVLWTPPADTSK